MFALLVALTASLLPTFLLSPAASAESYALMVSSSPDRSSPVPLAGTTQSGDIYVFTQPATGVSRVRFYLDDPTMSGTPRQVEKGAPHDFAGTAADGKANPFRTGGIAPGTHVITAAIDLTGGGTTVLSATFTVQAPPPGPSPYGLLVSQSADRADAITLDATTQSGAIFVFVQPTSGVSRVRFFLDDPARSGTPYRIESGAPYDLGGTAANGTALPFDTRALADGSHTITAAVDTTQNGTLVTSASFTVAQRPRLTVDRTSLVMSGVAGGPSSTATIALGTSDSGVASFTAVSSVDWLSTEPSSGSAPGTAELAAAPGGLAAGTHTGTVRFSASGYDPVAVTVEFQVRETTGSSPYDIVMSSSRTRSNPRLMDGATLSGSVYVFLDPVTDVTRTSWWLDSTSMQGSPWRVDTVAPHDFMPGSSSTKPLPFDTASVPDGHHTITVLTETVGGVRYVSTATFVTSNDTNSLVWSDAAHTIEVDPGVPSPTTFEVGLTATKPGTVASVVDDAPFVTTGAGQVTTPATVLVTVDPAGLARGVYRFTVSAGANSAFGDTLPITVKVGDSLGCEPLACDLIKVDQPYVLPFDGDQEMLVDRNGVGTGFTTVLPSSGQAYRRGLLEVNPSSSSFSLGTSAGSFKDAENSQENALGVGFNGGVVNVVTTTLAGVPSLTGKYEQAGLWFGYDQDNVDKLDLVSTGEGLRVEHILEVGGGQAARKQGPLLTLGPDDNLILSLRADPETRRIEASYRVNSGAWTVLGSFLAPGAFFSADAAGIDPRVGTRTFAGVYASKRNAATAPVFRFGDFSVTGQPVATAGELRFERSSYPVPFPTSMAFGPDGRLYVLTLTGQVRALTFDAAHQVVGDQTITTLGSRLALGLTVEPGSTSDDMALWVAHSSPSLDAGEADSGMITRLSGPGFGVREDVITGLPRSIANHGPNSLHFGPDGRLYMVIGGNTGAGAANTAGTEFGDRGEQPLSAALLVADVSAAGFDGSCADPIDIYASDDCDVHVYSSGLRNTYDFVFHSNGKIYAPDNGLGVVGSYPPSATAPCAGFGSTESYKTGGNNPGDQPDELNLLVEGGYYGHPNPTRGECVFGNGSFQGVAPTANYQAPMFDLGRNRSANGIIEYTGDGFCGSLTSDLLVSNYSVGDDILGLTLAPDGRSVSRATSLASGFVDPLPLVQAPDGSLVVGEFGGKKITTLEPVDSGCWSESTPSPVALLDAGGVAIGDRIYLVGGKTPAGHQTTVHVYDVSSGTWSTAPSIPGVAVENPATVEVNGKLYVFGGSSAPFSGAIRRSAMFDPATNTWSLLPDMPTARGGAAAQHVAGKVFVLGGMTGDGASSAVVEVFDLASQTWSAGPSLTTPRDNPGAAVLGGVIYTFGGRTRLADATVVNGALSSVEALDPTSNSWVAKAPMPTGRRTMGSAVVDGKALLVGGEGGTDGTAFRTTERYDPVNDSWETLWPMTTPRHGAVTAAVNGRVHVIGGGVKTGSDWTDKHEVFRPPA